jgi:8-oxo-dGTP pyrophosphatase MutT (NUDIX family)
MTNKSIDLLYRTAYKIVYPIALTIRKTSLYRHDGVTIAVWYDDSLLMVKHSYRPNLTLPGGGVKRGEDPAVCIVRELYEEVNLKLDMSLLNLLEIRQRVQGRGQESLYEAHIDSRPPLKIDNQEIIFAGFVRRRDILTDVRDPLIRDYLMRVKN